MGCFSNDPSIKKDHSPSMTLDLAFDKTISSLTKIVKASNKLLSMTVKLTRACPFTSKNGASHQIDGKKATLEGGRKEQLKHFE